MRKQQQQQPEADIDFEQYHDEEQPPAKQGQVKVNPKVNVKMLFD